MPRMREDGPVDQLHNLVRDHPDFEVLSEPTHSRYFFRYVPNGLSELQEEFEVQQLLDRLNEEIVDAVVRNGFTQVMTTRVRNRIAIQIRSQRTVAVDVDTTFEAIARWGRLLSKKLCARYETTPDMEANYV
jgi:glutamate/tyrosine decarboxylase-like PLP-dependent enzyme